MRKIILAFLGGNLYWVEGKPVFYQLVYLPKLYDKQKFHQFICEDFVYTQEFFMRTEPYRRFTKEEIWKIAKPVFSEKILTSRKSNKPILSEIN